MIFAHMLALSLVAAASGTSPASPPPTYAFISRPSCDPHTSELTDSGSEIWSRNAGSLGATAEISAEPGEKILFTEISGGGTPTADRYVCRKLKEQDGRSTRAIHVDSRYYYRDSAGLEFSIDPANPETNSHSELSIVKGLFLKLKVPKHVEWVDVATAEFSERRARAFHIAIKSSGRRTQD